MAVLPQELEARIDRASDQYYNIALEKAQVRDLTGAVMYLERSLEFNKYNSNARNLLGLVYLEMGEVVDALAEWVIGKNLDPQNALADEYLRKVQSHQLKLGRLDQAIKRYDQALYYVRHDNADLAMLQLKKVTDSSPKLLRAHQLLALLYIKEEDYDNARYETEQVLSIDAGNTVALRYMEELDRIQQVTDRRAANEASRKKVQAKKRSSQNNESIVPTYKEGNGTLKALGYIGAGALIGLLFAVFLILPTRVRSVNSQINSTSASYEEKLAAKELEIGALETDITELEAEIASLEADIESYTGEAGIIEEYNNLLNVLYLMASGDYLGALEAFDGVNSDIVSNETFQTIYTNMSTEFSENAVPTLYTAGLELYTAGSWESALTYFTKVLELMPDYPEVIFYTAVCYTNLGDSETAAVYYTQLTSDETYAQTTWGQQAAAMLGQ